MKKILNVVLVITSISFASCTQYPEKPVELENVLVDTTVDFIEITPMKSAQITRYSTKGLVAKKTTDTAYVFVTTQPYDAELVIAVPSHDSMILRNDSVILTAEKWSGGYENDWTYTIKK